MAEERMSAYFSVFNCHVNDADERARILLQEFFPRYLTRLEEVEAEGNGIMYIFHVPEEPAIASYIALVTAFVNES